MKLKDVSETARKNWRERNILINELKQGLTKTQKKKIDKVDPKFLRKLYNFPGDITTYRIYNVLSKI